MGNCRGRNALCRRPTHHNRNPLGGTYRHDVRSFIDLSVALWSCSPTQYQCYAVTKGNSISFRAENRTGLPGGLPALPDGVGHKDAVAEAV